MRLLGKPWMRKSFTKTLWPPVSDEARSVKGKWMTYYPADTERANIVLTIDWHAYKGDARSPLMERTIDTRDSGYHPGKHHSTIKHIYVGLGDCEAACELVICHILAIRSRSSPGRRQHHRRLGLATGAD